MTGLTIRPTAEGDREAIFEISRTVWEGQDYIPKVWDAWLSEDRSLGYLLTAEVDGRVVGIQHTAMQPGSVAWMEGIRVHPDLRGQGIAHRLLEEGLAEARRRGAGRARLSTADINTASRAVASGQGFREVGHFFRYSAPPLEAYAETARACGIDAEMFRRITGVAASVLVTDGWTAVEIPDQTSPDDFPVSYVVEGDRGLALARQRPDQDRLSVAYIAGDSDAARHVGLTLRNHAASYGLGSVGGALNPGREVERGLSEAGFERQTELSIVVYERAV